MHACASSSCATSYLRIGDTLEEIARASLLFNVTHSASLLKNITVSLLLWFSVLVYLADFEHIKKKKKE